MDCELIMKEHNFYEIKSKRIGYKMHEVIKEEWPGDISVIR